LATSTGPTLEFPAEAALYLFATFGCLWLAAALRLADRAAPLHPLLGTRVVLLALALTAGTGWTLGMIRENRITYILAPFVIALSLAFFASPRARRIARCKRAWIAGAATLLCGVAFLGWLDADPERVVPLRAVFGESFHFGITTSKLVAFDGEWVEQIDAWASPMNGPVVLLHLAASAWLAVGAWTTRLLAVSHEPPE
jgi:hypothetical protein